ncbi:MAG: DUF418 domain-containing protein [Streptosporangiales bacterium]|nr:DUF418 domain-containing protein [Streptosporangiales bacterium]
MVAWDVLRGFAVGGIVFVNIPQTMGMLPHVGVAPEVMRLFVVGRFYPIFFLLFGLSFGIFLASAARRTEEPRVPMVRRLAALAVIGALHQLLQPNEVLLPFAVVGLVVLLPLSYASYVVNVAAGLGLTVAGLALGIGGYGVLPGIFVLGFAMAQGGLHRTLPARVRTLTVALLVAAATAVACYLIIVGGAPEGVGIRLGLVFSLAMSAGYACAVLLLLRTALRPAMTAALAPMGRMALTNYLSATLIFVLAGPALGLRGSADFGTAALLAAAIVLVQLVWSALWMRRYRYGPAEWAWRCITWWQRVPLRRPDAEPAG